MWEQDTSVLGSDCLARVLAMCIIAACPAAMWGMTACDIMKGPAPGLHARWTVALTIVGLAQEDTHMQASVTTIKL